MGEPARGSFRVAAPSSPSIAAVMVNLPDFVCGVKSATTDALLIRGLELCWLHIHVFVGNFESRLGFLVEGRMCLLTACGCRQYHATLVLSRGDFCPEMNKNTLLCS